MSEFNQINKIIERSRRVREASPELLDIAFQFLSFGKFEMADGQTAEEAFPEMFAAARAVVNKVTKAPGE